MKTKFLTLLIVVFTGMLFLTVGILTAADAPDTVTMDSKVYAKHKKGIVVLGHKKHYEAYKIACAECHHVYKDGKNIWKEGDPVQKCEACHSKPKKPKNVKMKKAEKIKEFHYSAIHENCKSCHRKVKKKDKNANAPVKCAQCHPKKSKKK